MTSYLLCFFKCSNCNSQKCNHHLSVWSEKNTNRSGSRNLIGFETFFHFTHLKSKHLIKDGKK